jgi:hypothetical protein
MAKKRTTAADTPGESPAAVRTLTSDDGDGRTDAKPDGEAEPQAPAEGKGGGATVAVVEIGVEVVWGSVCNATAEVAILPRYLGLPFAGPALEFDYLLKSWLSRALELGMIGSGLGELFLLPIKQAAVGAEVKFENLLLVGMGEPGRFGADDLRFMMTNVTVAVKALGHHSLCTELIGSRRGELSLEPAARAVLQGVLDGHERCQGMYESMADEERARFVKGFFGELTLVLALREKPQAEAVLELFKKLSGNPGFQAKARLHVAEAIREVGVLKMTEHESPADTIPRDEQLTMLRVACRAAKPDAGAAGADGTVVFQYSALSHSATVSVREQEANAYFVNRLPDRMVKASSPREQEDFGRLWTTYLIPEDFHRVIQGSGHLTLVLDESTACYPWEMVALRGHSATQFLGVDYQLTRLFRTLLSQAPGMPPPLNHRLRVLVIADPYRARPLEHARAEALAVIEALRRAQELWGGEYMLRATVRIGSYPEDDQLRQSLDQARAAGKVVESARPCEPLELLTLILNGEYDVVHYAGHGEFNPASGRMGWVFDRDCVLSAQEIFRIRQVPRLVFANACFSAATSDPKQDLLQRVGLAQAFFARGIQNYIGTGWEIKDDSAAELAHHFYRQVLGIVRAGGADEADDKAPPATLGKSLADARVAIMGRGTTWGAYQHYGQANAKLLPFRNVDEGA